MRRRALVSTAAAALAVFAACGARAIVPASCEDVDGGAMTCPFDAPVCMSEKTGLMNAPIKHDCLSLKACASDPSCDCLRRNAIDQCLFAATTQCTDGPDGIHVTCND